MMTVDAACVAGAMQANEFDVIIIGGGPAGLSAAIYARRARRKTLVIEKAIYGGLIFNAAELENYPGGIMGESGAEFSERIRNQAEALGTEFVDDEVIAVDMDTEMKLVRCYQAEYQCRSIIIATGSRPRTLGVAGEKEFTGRGVSYCATCDAPFFTGLEVYVVGGGNSAVEEAIYLSKFARKVTIIHRRDTLRADRVAIKKAEDTPNVCFMLSKRVREIRGDELLTSIIVEDVVSGDPEELVAAPEDGRMGVFVFSGSEPYTELFRSGADAPDMEAGYLVTDDCMRVLRGGIPMRGVYAAGDVRAKGFRQVVTAAADGAVAAMSIEHDME